MAQVEPGSPSNDQQLFHVINSGGGNMRKIQTRICSRLVQMLGIRWASSLQKAHVGPVVQDCVVSGGIAGVDTDAKYNALKLKSVKGDFYLVQQISQTQNKTVKKHRDRVNDLIVALFEETTDPMVNSIKLDVFGVADGKPIVGLDHQVVRDMMDLPPPLKNGSPPPPQ